MFDDESGYDLSDPKHPTYVERWSEFADNARKAAKENGPASSAPRSGANPSPAVPLTDTTTDSGLAKDARSAGRRRVMDIGKEGNPYTIEPLQDPVPGREREVVPEPEYAPVEAPEREREKVPA